jgi:DNA-binding transcriptional LysR family regulator
MTDKTDQRLRWNLRQLEVFVATARSGSTHAAAQRVARSQSAASAALATLESALDTALFDRHGRGLRLNEQGRALLPGAVALLDQAAELQALFASEHGVPLRLAASLTIGEYLLPDLIAGWRSLHPSGRAQLMIGNTSRVIESVLDLAVEVGFIEGPQTHADLRVRRWLEDELVVVAAPNHPLVGGVRGRAVKQKALADASWILREPGSGTRQAADAWLVEHLGPLSVDYELGSTEAIKRLAAAGVGLACLSRHALGVELAQGRLVEVRTQLPRAVRRLAIVTRRDRRPGRASAAFVQHCLDRAAGTMP